MTKTSLCPVVTILIINHDVYDETHRQVNHLVQCVPIVIDKWRVFPGYCFEKFKTNTSNDLNI